MASLDEILDRLADEAVLSDEQVNEIREASAPSAFREKVKTWKSDIEDGRRAKDRIAVLENTSKARRAFEDQGVDWDALRPLERESAQSFADFEDEDKLEAYIKHNDLRGEKGRSGRR